MTDRELLELAAKAAGMPIDFSGDVPMLLKSNGATFPDVERWEFDRLWNPLTDDGDALRLAVKLDMSIDVELREQSTYAFAGPGAPRMFSWEMWGTDKAAATRRAIVRAAAALAS